MPLKLPELDRRKLPGMGPDTLLLGILFLTLALSAVLAYQAQDAARSHRRAAEAALRDYAAFASWELGRRAEARLATELADAAFRVALPVGELPRFSPGVNHRAGEPHPDAVRRRLAWCRCPEAVYNFFEIDLRSGELQPASDPASSPAFRAWLAELLAEPARPTPPQAVTTAQQAMIRVDADEATRTVIRMDTPRIRSEAVDGQKVSIIYTVVYENAAPSRAYGFAFHPARLAEPVLREIISRDPLLPASLTNGAPNEAVLRIVALSSNGDTIYRSPGAPTTTPAVADTLGGGFGDVSTRVAVRPEVAERLIIGGMPRSRLPLLGSVFALTLGLVGVAVVQLWRQQQLVRLRSDFVSGVSHELRTPLAQIRLFADLLEGGRLKEPQRQRSVRIIGEEARRLAYLVENILRFSRSERHGNRIAPEPAEVGPLLREIVDAFAPLARAREVEIRTELPAGIWATVDRDALRQVMLNLLDNAVKYGPAGQQVTVGADVEDDWVRIRVDDQGPGIPEAERERVWEPYRRLARDAESATGGSGIGLAVVRDLVGMHGGRARIEDVPGGARVVVYLPRLARSAEQGTEMHPVERKIEV